MCDSNSAAIASIMRRAERIGAIVERGRPKVKGYGGFTVKFRGGQHVVNNLKALDVKIDELARTNQ